MPASDITKDLQDPRKHIQVLLQQPPSLARNIALAYARAARDKKTPRPVSWEDASSASRERSAQLKVQIQHLQHIKEVATLIAQEVSGEEKNKNPELWYAFEAALGMNGHTQQVPNWTWEGDG